MVESSTPQNPEPNTLPPPPPSPPPLLPSPPGPPVALQNPKPGIFSIPRPALRVTSEFDSESSVFLHKISCRLIDRLAKFKLSFQNNPKGDISYPQLGFLTMHLSVYYDVESRNALIKGAFDIGNLQFCATQDVKERKGEMSLIASLPDPSYKLVFSSSVPSVGLPRATFRFPLGEVSLEENKDEETKRVRSVNGILKCQILNGICTALYRDNDLNLRYSYKDEEMTFIPSISLPSNALSFAFKRRFSPSDKLSYWYHFKSNDWSTVYKHTIGKALKLKAGYDSDVRLGWASLWVGDEYGKTKTVPMKMKVQFMLQVPQDDIINSYIMFRVKKRWDF